MEKHKKVYRLTKESIEKVILGDYRIKNLPDDAILENVWTDYETQTICLLFDHVSFPLCSEGISAWVEIAELICKEEMSV